MLPAGAMLLTCPPSAVAQASLPAPSARTAPARLDLPTVNNAVLTELAAQVVLVHDVPGLGIAVATRDGLHAFGVAGVRKAGTTERLTPDDRFHIGSCGKLLTAILVARLVDRGRLTWDSTLDELLPGITLTPAAQRVTVAELLSHRSGLPSELDRSQLVFLRAGADRPADARRELARRLLGDAGSFLPDARGRFAYSNVGYAIAGHVAEAVTGVPFEQLMRVEVFEPLGMAQSGFGAPGTFGIVDQPRGHNRSNVPIEPGWLADNPAPLSPAGTMHVSLRDWASAIAVLLGGGPPDFLSDEARRRLTTTSPDARPGDPANPSYALGVAVTDTLGHRSFSHAGSNTLWFARFLALPEQDVAEPGTRTQQAAPPQPARMALTGGWAVLVVANHGGDAGVRATQEVIQELLALSRRSPAAQGESLPAGPSVHSPR